jgi:signal peptidase I
LKLARAKDWVLQIALALLIFFGFLRPYVVEAFRIPTPSMEQTLLVGDHLLVLKVEEGQRIPWTDRLQPLIHGFRGDSLGLLMPATGVAEPGEVLVFRYPGSMDKDFIKRVVAVAGDTVKVIDDTLYVNGLPSPEWATCFQDPFYPNPLDYAWPECIEDRAVRRVPDLAYDKLGRGIVTDAAGDMAYVVPPDHVFMMGDNRDHSNDSRVWGPLDLDLVKGEALVTYWSWTRGDGLPKFDRIARLIR